MKNTSLIPLREGNSRVFSREEVEKDSRLHTYDKKPLSKGSLYRAYVPFVDDPDTFKPRPVLVLSNIGEKETDVKVVPFTSAITYKEKGTLKEKYALNKVPHYKYPVLNWKENYFDVPVYAVIDYNTVSEDYYVIVEKSYFLESITAKNFKKYSEYIMDESQFKEIREVLKCKRKRKSVSEVNPKTDPKLKYFDWKTMQIPYSEWMEYRKKSLTKDKEREETKAIQKEEKLKQEFRNLRLYYLYDVNSRSMGEQHGNIFKDGKSKKYTILKDWDTYETYMGKYFPIISSMKDEIEGNFYSKLPTMNEEETVELKEHILSDEELRIFLDESF